jgi:hypothetical protein
MFLSDFSRGKVIGSTGRASWFELSSEEMKECLKANKVSSYVKMTDDLYRKCATVFGSDLNVNPKFVIDSGILGTVHFVLMKANLIG